MRWLGLAVLLLLLANAGWWLLGGDGRALWQRSPTPQVSEDAAPASAVAGGASSSPSIEPPARAREASAQAAPPLSQGPAAAPLSAGLLVPVQGVEARELSDTFGDPRGNERRHEALDIMAPAGTPVLAVADGHVEKLFDSERGGLTLYQFEPTGRWCYYYAHLQAYAPGMAEGAQIRRGQVIGYVGSTGNADPSAPHLHFAVFALGPERQWWTGTPVNPYPLLGGSLAR